ncbi:TrkA family potassium uptake protein [Cytophagaceae bacterium ABcell3]|nr:TrkA family potassium uptake protein [Cytophagaceae bacterium ABcell3]
MVNKFAVIGLGKFGTSIARSLATRGAEVLALDLDPVKVDQVKDEVAYAVVMNSTDTKTLIAHNIQSMDAVVVAIGDNFESLMLTTVILLELKIKRIIARAGSAQQKMILEKMGVTEILSPEDEVGKTVAEILLHPTMKTFLPLPDDYEIVEIQTPVKISNRAVKDIGLRERYNLNLITIKRNFEEVREGETVNVEHVIGVPKGDTILYENDIIIILGKAKDVDKFVEVNS